jgi:hypothetical protein
MKELFLFLSSFSLGELISKTGADTDIPMQIINFTACL